MKLKTINSKLQYNPIAIVGMASLFPEARNLREYWQNIVNKVDCIKDIPPSRWNIKDYYDPNPKAPEKTYSRKGGFIPDVNFNSIEFGLPPNVLEVTDIFQLLSLIVAKEAMEDAGYGQKREFDRDAVGVVLGVAQSNQLAIPLSARLHYPVWEKVLKSSGLSDRETQTIIKKIKSAYVPWNENAFPGMLANVVAGRIANRLNLGGTNCVVDAACASSLAAVKIAVSELLENRCDMILTGGVDVNNSITTYICFSKTPAISPRDSIRPFDAESDGMIVGEGIGMMVLKRLEDAIADNDRIYAVIKGIGSSSDGKNKSIYAPSKEGQVKALKRAYEDAGCSPDSISLIEAHGTGTKVGDSTEFSSLKEFFGDRDSKQQSIALGSIKSQIGHTKAAAGAASLIKTALALHHKILPPTINVTKPNPKLKIQDSPFYLNTETRPWIDRDRERPRRAGVSSFGFGGTNYHLVLEEYRGQPNHIYRLHKSPESILLFADSPERLLEECQEILTGLNSEAGDREYLKLVDLCRNREIPLSAARIGFVTNSRTETCQLLQIAIDGLKNKVSLACWEHPQGIYYRSCGVDRSKKVVALFSGQGSQYLNMGREVGINFPELPDFYSNMDRLFLKDKLSSPSEIVFAPPVFTEAEQKARVAALQSTQYAQPAIGAFSAGLYQILSKAGFKPDFVAGHSFGELTALWAAGVMSDRDYCFLVKARGEAMAIGNNSGLNSEGHSSQTSDPGKMLVVKAEIAKVQAVIDHFPGVKIANFNSPSQVVLAGKSAEIARVQQILEERGETAFLLPVAAAFHTPMMEFARKSLAKACKKVTFNNSQIPVYTNVTGHFYPREPEAIQKILENHLSNPVLFQQEIENIYAAGGYYFVEFGPKRIVTNLVKDILGDRPHIAVALNPNSQKDSDRSLREAVVQLRVAGLPLKHLDPYQLPIQFPPIDHNKGFEVRLSGTNYISEATKMGFEKALHSDESVQLQSRVKEPKIEKQLNNLANLETKAQKIAPLNPEESITSNLAVPLPIKKKSNMSSNAPELKVDPQKIMTSLEYLLVKFQEHQTENLHLHKEYLQNQTEYLQTFLQLVREQNSLVANSQSSPEAIKLASVAIGCIERSSAQFHAHQSDTLNLHEQYLLHQIEYSKNFFQVIQQEYSQLITNNETQPLLNGRIDRSLESKGDRVLNEGIDFTPPKSTVAINSNDLREEIVSANGKQENQLSVNIQEQQTNLDRSLIATEIRSQAATTPNKIEINPQSETTKIDLTQLPEQLLAVTSEKTGYPVEMLNLEMDMEADLGIDSIKRVEILAAMQKLYPDLPDQLDLEELAEQRTIAQIVTYFQNLTNNNISLKPSENRESNAISSVPTDRPVTVSSAPNAIADPIINTVEVATLFLDENLLGEQLLAVTSEKTGYPVEMLNLEMDMEADLGIDSIKRVEILAAMQKLYPDLPDQLDLEELAEQRTIAQIVAYLGGLADSPVKKQLTQSENRQSLPDHNILCTPVRLKTLPEPDYWDLTLPKDCISLVTDDGSVTTATLAQSLKERGWQVVVLSFPPYLIPQRSLLLPDIPRVMLTDLSEENLQQQLTEIATNYGEIGAFIHLHPLFKANFNGSIDYLEEEKAIVKSVFFMAKHLKKSLNQAASHGRSCFCTVTRLDGALGLDSQTNFSPIGAGLAGLTKSLNWEWQRVFCRAIDLSPTTDPELSAKQIVAELHDPNFYISEVAYGDRGRVTPIA